MRKGKNLKKELINFYEKKLKENKSFIIIKPLKITPNDANKLRKQLKANNSSFSFLKNRLFKIALKNSGIEDSKFELKNENAIVFVSDDISSDAKITYQFFKESEKGEIQSGFVDGITFTGSEIIEIAKLPQKDILIAMTVGAFKAPISGFVNVLRGNLSGLLSVLSNIAKNK